MMISIIIPIRNQRGSLLCVLESIKYINYNKNDMEVIVVDDGSEENIESCYKEYENCFNLKYIKNSTNLGRGAARNIGAKEASGKYLLFNDGDRMLSTELINEHLEILEKEDVVCIGRGIDIYLKKIPDDHKAFVNDFLSNKESIFRKNLFCYYYQEVVMKLYEEGQTSYSDRRWISLMSGNFSIRKDLYFEVGGFDENFKKWGIENMEFGYILERHNVGFRYHEKALNYHLYHKGNRNVEDLEEAIRYFYDKYQDETIMDYYLFLQGKLSLGELTGIAKINDVMYKNTLIGSRYISK